MSGRSLVVTAMVAGLFVTSLDSYVVAGVLPPMIGDLGIPLTHLERATPILSGFLVGYVGAMPLLAGVADARGRELAYVFCLVLFAAGSVLTAVSGDLATLVAGRAAQGAAGGAVVPITFAAAGRSAAPGVKLVAIGLVGGVQELGSLLGPVYGALVSRLNADLTWRLIFWLNVPLALICLLAFVAVWATNRGEERDEASGAAWDPLSSLLLAGAVAALVVALYPNDPAASAVNAPIVLVPALLIACLLGSGLVLRISRGASFVGLPLLRSRGFVGVLLTNLLVGGALVTALVEIPLLARTVFSLDALGAAGLLARFLAGIPVGALLSGWLAVRLGNRPVIAVGLLVAAAGFVAMSGWNAAELEGHFGPFPRVHVVLVGAGFGFGLLVAPLLGRVLGQARAQERARALSVVVLARTLGMVLGLAALSGLGLHHFYELVNAAPIPNPVLGSPDFLQQAAALQERYRSALLAEYREIFLLSAAACGLAAVVAVVTLSPGPASGSRTAGG